MARALRRLAWLATPFWLVACSIGSVQDGPPDDPPPAGSVPEVIPRVEPKSKYGNPRSYVVLGKRYHVLESSQGFVERGIASWYGKKFHGRRTSSGEAYDMYGMTAAHKNLPLPTYVRVTNLENDRSVVLRVNDRGPFHENRIIDLTYTAAKALGIVRKGTGYVEVRALDPGQPVQPVVKRSSAQSRTPVAESSTVPVKLYLQVGAFAVQANALRLHDRLQSIIGPISKVQKAGSAGHTMYRVRLGPLIDVTHADRLTERIVAMGLESPQVVLE